MATRAPRKRRTKAVQARREHTEASLVAAVGTLLRRGGLGSLGLNAVAAEAGVDKVLVYRYFGDLEGLLAAYAKSAEFWPSVDDLLGADRAVLRQRDLPKVCREILRRYRLALRERPVTLDLLAWECVERSTLTKALEAVREERSLAIMQALTEAGFDLGRFALPLNALFGAALNYLAVRAREKKGGLRWFAGVDLGTEEGWTALEATVEAAIRGVLATPS